MVLKNKSLTVFCLAVVFFQTACSSKRDFLDEKPNSRVFTPKSISELQLLLDKSYFINEVPEIGILSSDEFYLLDNFWESLGIKERNSYTWESDIFEGEGRIPDWNIPYKQVFTSNVVLEELDKGTVTNATQLELDQVRGIALFIRGFAFYNIAQHFADIYDEPGKIALGIPLRLKPGIDEVSTRASLKETYEQLISDISGAAKYLIEIKPNSFRNRPCKAAAYALLARVYLSMRVYDKAELYADSSLKSYDSLINYNSVNLNDFLPFTPLNKETTYQANVLSSSAVLIGLLTPGCIIDSNLYKSYEANDLRKSVYFIKNGAGRPNIKGGYTGSLVTFGGLAVDEVMLIKAECLARANMVTEAMDMLNNLLRYRYKQHTYVDKTATNGQEALRIILEERKKELVFRGVRWTDLKRLNREGANISIERKISGKIYKLAPNDKKYVLPIPPDVIQLSGIEQNQR